jgi:hypothetical protein
MNKNAPLIGFAVIVLGIIVVIVGVTYQHHTSEGINSNNIPAVPKIIGASESDNLITPSPSQAPLVIDASFSISEANISIIDYKPIAQVTFADLKKYPELERSMHSDINSSRAWFGGTRLVNIFEGNVSRFYAVVDKICEGKLLAECNCGMLFEYHGDYYLVSFQEHDPNLYHLGSSLT